ncbi:MAG: hypothetical protein V3R34_06815 [Hyphomicrobium sp.]
MMTKIGLIAASLLIATTAAASAHSTSIDSRQNWQAKRIESGRQSGSITWFEGLKLRAEQHKITHRKAKYRADGRQSYSERKELQRLQHKAKAHINNEKYDSWRRVWWLPRFGL